MKLGQVNWNGRITAAIVEGDAVRPIPGYSLMDLIRRASAEDTDIRELARHRAAKHAERLPLALPISPREIWACGCTYEMSAAFRDAEHGTREGFYAHVYRAERPEIFFKGNARVCVGPGEPIGLRSDSHFTAPEPELAVLMGEHREVLGYTLANDVSAWDIERENPLYLPQSKIYDACCAIGPVFVTPDELTNPYGLEMTMTIQRAGEQIYSGSVSTSKLNRKIETLVDYLYRANAVPDGSVLLTGTGIIVTQESALEPGDKVTIRVPEIGELSNPCAVVG